MKKTVIFLLIIVILVICTTIPIVAQNRSYDWYCKHVKGHVQPNAPSELSFIASFDGYYIDKKHTSFEKERVIYLTFDAGYENGNVTKILDILKAEDVTAAFFVLEHLVVKEPTLIKRMADEGHLVCNHTATHKDVSNCDENAFLDELHTLESACLEKTGVRVAPYYRPPKGRFSEENLRCAQENGYKTVFWSFAYPDWENERQMPLEKAKRIISENLHNGEVMLLHPTSATNAAILSDLIQELKREGWRFGSLDELTGEKG